MRYTFVLNENAGRLRRAVMLGAIGEVFAEEEIEILSDPEAASAATGPGDQVLVAVGGDGTVNRLLPLAARTGAALGILPAGTANDLARALGIPGDARDACRVIHEGSRRSLDLLTVNGVPFATCGGVGLAADAAARVNRWRSGTGWRGAAARTARRFVYALAAASELGRLGRGCRAEVEWESACGCGCGRRHGCGHGRLAGPLLAAFASNVSTVGGRYRTAPRARMDDGLLDLCLLPAPRNAAHRALVLRAALGGSVLSIPGARQTQTRSVVIRTEMPALFFGDGEILARGCAFTIEVQGGALGVLTRGAHGQAAPREEAA